MRFPGPIAVAILVLMQAGGGAAQTLRDARPPAELPPAGYADKQYVDSGGCVYVRAGVDGAVTWVPRVDRTRRQVCGYRPTLDAAAPAPAQGVAEGTLDTPSPAAVPAAAPATVTATATAQATAQAPAQAAVPATAPAAQARPRPVAAPAPQPVPRMAAPARTQRVVERHILEQRQNALTVSVPRGYVPVWTDGRLNPARAVRGTAPSLALVPARVPRGYAPAWEDGRLNPNRGGRGIASPIWTDDVPQRLVQPPITRAGIRLDDPAKTANPPFWTPPVAVSADR